MTSSSLILSFDKSQMDVYKFQQNKTQIEFLKWFSKEEVKNQMQK